MKYMMTDISLPPGPLRGEQVRAFLGMVLQRFQWFEPRRYGSASLAHSIAPGRVELAPLVAFYEEYNSLGIAAQTDREYLLISSTVPGAPPCAGMVTWATSLAVTRKQGWRDAHAKQVAESMRLLQAPLAVASPEQDIHSKTRRLVPQVFGSRLEFTVRDYSEGLAGLFWRNFFGPPFVRLFGERLASLPSDSLLHLGDELVLVQPYPSPSAAGSSSSQERERHLISLLGPDCFYDHALHQPPTRRPVLEHLGQRVH